MYLVKVGVGFTTNVLKKTILGKTKPKIQHKYKYIGITMF